MMRTPSPRRRRKNPSSFFSRQDAKGGRDKITRCLEQLEERRVLAAFTPGNIAVVQLAAASNNTTGSILELNPATANQASPAQTISISPTGTNALRFSDSGTSSFLSDANDGTLLAFAAYNTTDTSDSDLATVTTLDPASDRAVGTLDGGGNFTLQTTYTGISGNQARSATTLDNANFFITDKGGLYTNGATSASLTTNILNARSFGGTVYISSTKATATVSTVSSRTANSLSGLPGLPADGTIQDFYLLKSGSNGSTYDILYTLDQNATKTGAATINKFSLVGGTWKANGNFSLAGNATAMIAGNNGSGGENLYVVTTAQAADNSLVKLTDTAGYNSAITINAVNNVTLYTAAGTTTLKGVDFVPQPAATTTTAISSINPLTVNQGQAVTFTATVTANSGSTAPTGYVEFVNGSTLLATATSETTSGTKGTFTVTSTSVPVGTFSNIEAFYFGDTGFSQSNSPVFGSTLTVNSAVGTSTSISSISPLTSTAGTAITFTANVNALSGSSAPGAGSVAFYDGGTSGTLLATATSETTSGTTGTFTVTNSTVPAGDYSHIQAFYTPSANFASSNSDTFGSTLVVTPPGVIAGWTFPNAPIGAPDNSPAPNFGAGTSTTLGMTNNYNGGNTAGDDVLSTGGTANPGFTENTWRVRGSGHNGWATYQNGAGAPEYTQGIELDTSTKGYSNIVFSFDWYSTTQGIRDLQVQYNTNVNGQGNGTNAWVNYQGPSPTGTFVATSNDFYNAGLSPISPTIRIDLSGVAAANDNQGLGIRLVSAFDSTGTLGNEYASATSTPALVVPYNNSSGNWRFGNLIFYGDQTTTTTTVAANPPGGQSPGQNVTFTATVTPTSGSQYPSGTISFYDGNKQIGATQKVAQVGTTNVGTASITLNTLAPGVHSDITAQYAPALDNGFLASGSSMNLVAGDPTDNPISYVINAPQATGVDVSPVVGQPFTGVVATFTDGTITNPAGFTASITWASGQTTNGTIAFLGTKSETNVNGQTVNVSLFSVTGTHTYMAPGSNVMSVTITDPNSNMGTVNPTARVAYAPLSVTPVPPVDAVVGVAINNQTVATFTDPGLVANLAALNISDPTTQFSASVDWGDGMPASVGTITYNSATQVFSVVGSHTYSQSGPHNITVNLTPLTVAVERIDSSDPANLNLVGDENGDGLTDSPSPDFIDQYVIGPTQSGSFATGQSTLYTTSLPTVATAGGNEALTNSSYSISEGELTLSTNGQYLVTGGYNATVSAWAPQQTFSDASVINRVIGTVDGNSTINTTTDLTDAYSGDNFRGVASTDGTQFWTSGHAGDNSDFVHYAQLGATTSTILTGPAGANDINTVEIFSGQLYEGVRKVAAGAPAGIYQIGTGLPTTAGQPQNLFIEVPQSNPLDLGGGSKPVSPFAFWMTDLANNPDSINGVNVAYVADAEMGITRYDYYQAAGENSPQWNFSYYIDKTGTVFDADYTVDGMGNVTATNSFDASNTNNDDVDPSKLDGIRGLTGRVVNGEVQLFAVTGFGTIAQPSPGGSLVEVTDPAVLTLPNGGLNTTDDIVTLATNPATDPSELTGVAFSPTAVVTSSAQVNNASPKISTAASPNITLGTTAPTLSDTAVLSNGYFETGSLLFTLSGPNGFTYSQTVGISGNVQRQRHLAHGGHRGGYLHLDGELRGRRQQQ